MKRTALLVAAVLLLLTVGLAFKAQSDGPYKVLKTARVGGEGGTDYIFADPVGRRLYITRGARDSIKPGVNPDLSGEPQDHITNN